MEVMTSTLVLKGSNQMSKKVNAKKLWHLGVIQ